MINDPPRVLIGSLGTLDKVIGYTEGDGIVHLTLGAQLEDDDSAMLASATISLDLSADSRPAELRGDWHWSAATLDKRTLEVL